MAVVPAKRDCTADFSIDSLAVASGTEFAPGGRDRHRKSIAREISSVTAGAAPLLSSLDIWLQKGAAVGVIWQISGTTTRGAG